MRRVTGKIACVPSSLVCTSPLPLSRSSMFNALRSSHHFFAANPPSSCVGSDQILVLDGGARCHIRRARRRIAAVKRAIDPHRMHDHGKPARHSHGGLAMAGPPGDQKSPVPDLVLALEPRQQRGCRIWLARRLLALRPAHSRCHRIS
jgi:hypothetical protein